MKCAEITSFREICTALSRQNLIELAVRLCGIDLQYHGSESLQVIDSCKAPTRSSRTSHEPRLGSKITPQQLIIAPIAGYGNLHEGCGIVFNLKPPATACKTAECFWMETISFAFQGTNDDGGSGPGLGRLIFDQAGNLYGTNWNAVANAGEVTQFVPSGGAWTLGRTYVSSLNLNSSTPNMIFNGITFDSAGNLYGTSKVGPNVRPYCLRGQTYNGCGTVYLLVPTGSGWDADIIYTFADGEDGKYPMAGLVADQAGNLYGTTSADGAGGGGVVFQLSPSGSGWTYHLIYALPGVPHGICLIPAGGSGCSGPWGTLLMDPAGNLYGATYSNGAFQSGNVFKLTRSNGSWTYTDLYDFTGGSDGANPISPLILDGNGTIFGTTANGGADGYGVAFEITP